MMLSDGGTTSGDLLVEPRHVPPRRPGLRRGDDFDYTASLTLGNPDKAIASSCSS